MRDAESLTHLAYGEIIKRFHLGSSHVFNSWDQLNEDERARWVPVFADVRKTLESKREAASPPVASFTAPMSVH